jgi:RNA polymerase sigma-70 factor (ECF subfamily)
MTDWPAIIREHGPLVWRIARRLLNHDADAADCFQQTFLAVVQLEAGEAIRRWQAVLTRLATARALEQLRVRYRRADRFAPLTEDPIGEVDDAVRHAAASELADRLRTALAEIDPRQAELLCLVYLEGRSNREAAEELGVTAAHAGVLLQRGRAALRERLAAFAPVEERRT